MVRGKRLAIGMTTLGVIGVIVVAIWLFSGQDTPNNTNTVRPAPSQTTTLMPFTKQNIKLLETSLNSSVKSEQMQAFAPELRSGEWDSDAVLPDGAKAEVIQGSFEPSRIPGRATAKIVVTGSVQTEFVLDLVQAKAEWLIIKTEQVG